MGRQIVTVSLTTFAPEELRETVRGSDIEHVQTSPGPFRGDLLRSFFGDSVLDSGIYSQDLLVSGTFPPDRVILGYILSGSEAGIFNGLRLAAHDIVVIAEDSAMEPYRLPAGTRWVAFQTRRHLLEQQGIPVPPRCGMQRYSGLSREGWQLGRFLAALVTGRHTHSAAKPYVPEYDLVLEDDLVGAFRRGIDASLDSPRRLHRARHEERARMLRQLEDYIDDHLTSEIRIGALCTWIGVSQRTLEYLFTDYYGMSPRRYLTTRRLNAVRAHLLNEPREDASIGTVARRFGFGHAGRFSAHYRDLFGELPSRTRQAANRIR